MQVAIKHNESKTGKARLEAAKKDYGKLAEEISPYIRKREAKTYSTSGGWKISE